VPSSTKLKRVTLLRQNSGYPLNNRLTAFIINDWPNMMKNTKKIAYFITGHGYGHGVRSSIIINALPAEIEVYLLTALPETFFRGELTRPFHYIFHEIDCGCLQPDTVAVDILGTLNQYAALNARRTELLENAVSLLQKLKIDLVIGDVPPLTFPIARQAQIPSLAVANFTWADIYAPYVQQYPQFSDLLETLRQDYLQANQVLWSWPHLPNTLFPQVMAVGPLFRQGQSCRTMLAERFGLNPAKKWCLIYIGNYGLEGIAWERLSDFTDYEFLGLYPLQGAPNNYHLLTHTLDYRYADLTASVDVVLGKLGYNLVAECLGLSKPVIFLKRQDFCEYEILKQPLIERHQGIEIEIEQLRQLNFKTELDQLTGQQYPPMITEALTQVVTTIRGLL
jgi:L-arabinokinase